MLIIYFSKFSKLTLVKVNNIYKKKYIYIYNN